VRVLNWNVSHGGGARIPAICQHIENAGPDLLGLTEFQTRNEPSLRANLNRLGYAYIATSRPLDNQNGLLIASRWPLDRSAEEHTPDVDRERWLAVRIHELDLDVVVLHIPGSPDNKFENGYGISGSRRKELLWERAIAWAARHKDRRAIMLGDFNTGFQIDTEGAMFKLSHYMTNLIDTGFVDVWRHLNPQVREYTWYSRRKDKATGRSEDLNGFRLDYIFASPALHDTIADVAMLQEPRKAGISDHASVVANLDLGVELVSHVVHEPEAASDAGRTETLGGSEAGDTKHAPTSSATPIAGKANLRVHLDLAPGDLPDMACGVNGQAFVQQLRPTYVTAEWVSGVLKEVRIWGPRVLRDGSLGKRELDHVWKRAVAEGGVNFRDLPPAVAAQLQSHIAKNDFTASQ
jgi:exonuclease III